MSASRKLLKIISLVSILSGVSYVIVGVLIAGLGVFGGSDAIAAGGTETTARAAATALAVIAALSAAVYLLMGFVGLRAANVPSKIGPVLVLSVAGIAMGAVNVTYWAWHGFASIDAGNIVNLALGLGESVLVFVLARNIKKERDIWR